MNSRFLSQKMYQKNAAGIFSHHHQQPPSSSALTIISTTRISLTSGSTQMMVVVPLVCLLRVLDLFDLTILS